MVHRGGVNHRQGFFFQRLRYLCLWPRSQRSGRRVYKPIHQGNVGVYARFAQATTDTVCALAYCECPGLLMFDQTREVRNIWKSWTPCNWWTLWNLWEVKNLIFEESMPATLYRIACFAFLRPTFVTRIPSEKRAQLGSPTGSPVSTSVNFLTVLVKHQKSLTSVLETLWIAIRYCVCTTMFKCSQISLTPVDFMHCIFWMHGPEEFPCRTL